MATTNVDFVWVNKVTTAQLVGTAVTTPPYVLAFDRQTSLVISGRVPGGAATSALGSNNGNVLIGGFYDQGFAKNGCFHVTTSGTTPVTCDLTNLATNATTYAGDTVFTTWSKLNFTNCGAANMTVGPGASSGNAILGGTTPTVPVPANSFIVLTNLAGHTVDSTHKNLTITPTSGGDICIGVGGA